MIIPCRGCALHFSKTRVRHRNPNPSPSTPRVPGNARLQTLSKKSSEKLGISLSRMTANLVTALSLKRLASCSRRCQSHNKHRGRSFSGCRNQHATCTLPHSFVQGQCLWEQAYQQSFPGVPIPICQGCIKSSCPLRVEPGCCSGWGFRSTPCEGPVTAESA